MLVQCNGGEYQLFTELFIPYFVHALLELFLGSKLLSPNWFVNVAFERSGIQQGIIYHLGKGFVTLKNMTQSLPGYERVYLMIN